MATKPTSRRPLTTLAMAPEAMAKAGMVNTHHFRLGTKLADGTSRKYHFHQVIE